MKTAPEIGKRIFTFTCEAAVNATKDLFVFTAKEDMKPLAVRITPLAVSGTSPTCVIELQKGGTKISTDNAVTALTAAGTLEAQFAQDKSIAFGDALKIRVTLGGTSPTFTGAVVELECLA